MGKKLIRQVPMTKDVKVVKNIKKSVQVFVIFLPTAIYLRRNQYIYYVERRILQLLGQTVPHRMKTSPKMYGLLRNLLSSDVQSQWERICRKMHKRDLWAGVNRQVTTGKHPLLWTAFRECVELHKLTVFTADAAKRQRSTYSRWCTSPRGLLCDSISDELEFLNDYV
jgi:hypothetical protein